MPQNLRMADLDDRDRAILRALQREGRLTNADLAERVNLSASACLRRVKILEDEGFIEGYAALLDPVRAELPSVAFVMITLDQQGRSALESFERAVTRHPEILECYLLAGTADYLVRVAFRDAAHFERLHSEALTQLPGVTRVQSIMTLRTVKKTTALPV
ncbi:MAG: Lrp/AsnC family transcriptional regulator [Rhodoblastus sp.]|nr:MAG: Lrp/AsnC family transcriptional regulator [Rhodoblastus sp.]